MTAGLRQPRLRAAALAIAAAAWTFAPAVQGADTEVEYVVQRSDTLIGLSNSIMVSPAAWQEVARLNQLKNPHYLRPGQVLKIPERLLRSAPVAATVVSATGDVRVADADAVATVGSQVAEGQSLQTGPASSAVLEQADGSRVRMPPSSLLQLATSRNFATRATDAVSSGADSSRGWFAGALRVIRGSVDVFATKVLRARPLEVVTPTAVVGVRGTEFRVGLEAAADSRTHSELIEGKVRFDAVQNAVGADLAPGFGASIAAGESSPTVARLLVAPDLSGVPARFERPLVRITIAGEANAMRVQVAADAAFEQVVSDQRFEPGVEVRIAGLEDAQWHLRARRIDANGIEGFDTSRTFVLKARPEPPAYRAPRSGAKQAVGKVDFAWAPNTEAAQSRLQVAEDATFTRIVEDRKGLTDAQTSASIAAAGSYFWRMASVRADGDQGPFGDPQAFELRPNPEPPRGGKSTDGSSLIFSWSGRPQDRQQVQLARDPAFEQIVADAELDKNEWTLPMPTRSGRYYFRYRSIEPDGYVSPYSSSATIDVPRDWRGLWLLLPLLLVF